MSQGPPRGIRSKRLPETWCGASIYLIDTTTDGRPSIIPSMADEHNREKLPTHCRSVHQWLESD